MGKVKKLFSPSRPAAPPPPPPPPPPARDDPVALEARRKLRNAELMRRGRAATILTSAQGAADGLGGAAVSPPAGDGDLGNPATGAGRLGG